MFSSSSCRTHGRTIKPYAFCLAIDTGDVSHSRLGQMPDFTRGQACFYVFIAIRDRMLRVVRLVMLPALLLVALLILISLSGLASSNTLEVSFIDVGQGDSALLREGIGGMAVEMPWELTELATSRMRSG